MFRVSGSVALAIVCYTYTVAEGLTQMDMLAETSPKRCTHERAYDMYGASCVGLKLQHIPSLKGSIEILDFSENKLLELKADTFASYTNLKFLYLVENSIFKIDRDALTPLTDLQTLDLSNNVIMYLPDTIFQLPSLRQLYLRDNPVLQQSLDKLPQRKPIKAPLEILDISGCRLISLPSWGMMPHLTHYNISHNSLKKLEPEHFAPMCKLEKVDITKSIDVIPNCNIKPAITWLQSKHVYFKLDDYSKLNSKEFEDCPSADFATLNATHHKCKAVYLEFQSLKSSRRTWLTVTGGLAGFLVGFMLLLYIMHRHNVAQTRTKAEKLRKPDNIRTAPANECDKQVTVPILTVSETNDVSRL